MSALLFAGGVGSLSVSHNAFNSTLLLFVLGFGSLSRGRAPGGSGRVMTSFRLFGPEPIVVVMVMGDEADCRS